MFTSKIICCAFIHRPELGLFDKKRLLKREFGYLWRPWGGQHRRRTPRVRIDGRAVEGWGGGSKIKMLASKVKVLEFGFPESVKIMSGDHGGGAACDSSLRR